MSRLHAYGRGREEPAEIVWRPSARFRGKLSYDYTEIELPQGAFETRHSFESLSADFTLKYTHTFRY